MRHEIIMPALGMSQDTGTLLAWHKSEGEAVAAGDILFEVETDKTTMEVEAPAAGFVVGISAEAGAEVPVGNVIAYIADTADADVPAAESAAPTPAVADALPEGNQVIMPTLGMAQDSGLLIGWAKQAGDQVDAEDVLFEVETDKSVAEVTAGHSGYLVARLAAAGDEVPTGEVIAIIAAEPSATLIDRGYQAGTAMSASDKAADTTPAASAPTETASSKTVPTASIQPLLAPAGARILASPKLKRMAMEAGLDLQLLADAGVSQPYHVSDLVQLKELSKAATQAPSGVFAAQTLEISAVVDAGAFNEFVLWLEANAGISNQAQILASMLGSSHAAFNQIGVATLGETQVYQAHQQISGTSVSDAAEELHLRDLRGTFIETATLGNSAVPRVALTRRGDQLHLQLSAPESALSAADALGLLNNFAERLADPMRQLL